MYFVCQIQQPGPVDPVLACIHLVCSLHSHPSILDQPPNQTGVDHKRQFGLQKKIPGANLPSLKTFTCPDSRNGQEPSLLTHHT